MVGVVLGLHGQGVIAAPLRYTSHKHHKSSRGGKRITLSGEDHGGIVVSIDNMLINKEHKVRPVLTPSCTTVPHSTPHHTPQHISHHTPHSTCSITIPHTHHITSHHILKYFTSHIKILHITSHRILQYFTIQYTIVLYTVLQLISICIFVVSFLSYSKRWLLFMESTFPSVNDPQLYIQLLIRFTSFVSLLIICGKYTRLIVLRMAGDPHWFEPPWHKRLPIVRGAKLSARELEDIMNDDTWTKAVFFRDPARR
jgi:hypothetical protein